MVHHTNLKPGNWGNAYIHSELYIQEQRYSEGLSRHDPSYNLAVSAMLSKVVLER